MFKSGNDSLNKTAVDTFKIMLDSQHFALIISPDDPKIVNPFKTAIDNFNSVYYSNKNFSISSNLYATAQQMILVKAFDNARGIVGRSSIKDDNLDALLHLF